MKKILFLSLLGLPVLFLGGCSLIDNNDSGITGDTKGASELEQQINGANKISGNIKETNNDFCGKKIKIPNYWDLTSETNNSFTIQTDKKDTEGYNVYVGGLLGNENEPIGEYSKELFPIPNNLVADIDCAPGLCYGIKTNNATMCGIYIDIYSDQPEPSDFPNNDGARYPIINNSDKIVDTVFEMLKSSFN